MDWDYWLPTESEAGSTRNGLWSTRTEVHASILGLVPGLIAGYTGTWKLAIAVAAIALGVRAAPGMLKEIKREPWYALGMLAVGYYIPHILSIVATYLVLLA